MKKFQFFGKHIEPACEYCHYSRKVGDGQTILCPKAGVVSPYYYCKRFCYNPTMRVPKRQPPLPQFEAKDFEI